MTDDSNATPAGETVLDDGITSATHTDINSDTSEMTIDQNILYVNTGQKTDTEQATQQRRNIPRGRPRNWGSSGRSGSLTPKVSRSVSASETTVTAHDDRNDGDETASEHARRVSLLRNTNRNVSTINATKKRKKEAMKEPSQQQSHVEQRNEGVEH